MEEIKRIAAEIKEKQHKLANELRRYCREQKDLWKTVPYLALMADGRGGYSGRLGSACRSGYWPLGRCEWLGVAVDLLTGELVSYEDDAPLADDEQILSVAISEFDAQQVIDKLKREIERPDSAEAKKTRESRRTEYSITEIFTERKHPLHFTCD